MSASLREWLLPALRPKTLPVSVVPVVVGSAAAHLQEAFAPGIAVLAIVTALLLQIATNLLNDYGDHVRGADGPDRLGPARASQSGGVEPRTVARAGLLALAGAGVAGMVLIAKGGWPFFWLGVASLLSAAAYTAGPYPLAYHGLGEVFVFFFFGPVAVLGTEYLQAGRTTGAGLVGAVCLGLLAAAILLVNNIRDADGDARAGKRTLVVRFGREKGRWLYLGAVGIAYALPLLSVWSIVPATALLSWLSLPLARAPVRAVTGAVDGPSLNQALADTARLELAFGVLFSVGLVL